LPKVRDLHLMRKLHQVLVVWA